MPTGSGTRRGDLALERGAPDNVTVVVADVIARESEDEIPLTLPVVVGAAGEPRVRLQLPNTRFPDDAQPDPDKPDAPAPFDFGTETAPQALIDAELIVPAAEQTLYDREREQEAKTRRRSGRKKIIGYTVGVLTVAAITFGTLFGTQQWLAAQWYVSVNAPSLTHI